MKYGHVLLILIATILSGLQNPAFPDEEVFDTKAALVHVENGVAHLKARAYEKAIVEFEAATDIYPDAESFYYLGYACYMRGKKGDPQGEYKKKARESFDAAYELNPNFTPSTLAFLEAIEEKAKQRVQAQPQAAEEEIAPVAATEPSPATDDTPVDAIFRADRQRTGYFNTSGVRDLKGIKWKLRIAFKTRTTAIVSSPVLVDGTVYFFDDIGTLHAVDVATGTEKWTLRIAGAGPSSPVVVNNTLFIGGSDYSLYAVDIKTGKKKWQFKSGDRRSFIFSNSSPTVANGKVYFGSMDKNLYAVDMETGMEKWRFKTGGGVGSPAFSDGMLYFESGDGFFYAVNVATGKEKWKIKTDRSTGATPAVADDMILFKCVKESKMYLCALDKATGQEQWSLYTMKNLSKPGGAQGTMDHASLKLQRQQDQWNLEVSDKSPLYAQSSPAVAGDTVYFGSGDGYVYAVDRKTGQDKWKYETGGQIKSYEHRSKFLSAGGVVSSPAVADGTVYFGSSDGYLYALDSGTGDLRWKFETRDVIRSSPIVGDGVVYFGAYDGYFYALH